MPIDPEHAGIVWTVAGRWVDVPGTDAQITLLDSDIVSTNDDGVREYPTRYRRAPAPVGGQANLHVAVAMALGLASQAQGAELVEVAGQFKAVGRRVQTAPFLTDAQQRWLLTGKAPE